MILKNSDENRKQVIKESIVFVIEGMEINIQLINFYRFL